ncbi:MAG TPA: sialate O-acetylesterase [Chthoniobacteraceae bacterium]|nr:sialate O-acetylesterase [Chthoniobacteraceae bacterium]
MLLSLLRRYGCQPSLLCSLALPALFSDHAVLQRSEKTPVWGTGTPGAEVKVSIAKEQALTHVGDDGKWRVDLNLSKVADGPHTVSIEGDGERIGIHDVLVGEVWFASGQSNMMFRLGQGAHADSPEARVEMNWLREFRVGLQAGEEPFKKIRGKWMAAIPPANQRFGAVSYFFGKALLERLGRPVGVVNNSWGNTPIEPWISPEALERDPVLAEDAARAREFHRTQPKEHDPLPLQTRHVPGYIYNGIVAPLVPYGIAGFIWYQGESNAPRAALYQQAFPLLINDWRQRWGRGDLPFYFCQIASYRAKTADPNAPGNWAELREAQTAALKLPATAMAVLIDAGEQGDIHPRDKKTPGERLAAIALAQHYGEKDAFASPTYASMEVDGSRVRLRFDHVGSGLEARPLPATYRLKSTDTEEQPLPRNRPDSPLEGFAVAGADEVFHWADARIEGENQVVVSSPEVPEPVAVRYGWADNPTVNLYNSAGLPAAPFRTDHWKLFTQGARLKLPDLPARKP